MQILLPTEFRFQACVQGGARRDPAVPAATPPRLRSANQRAAARAAGPAPLLCHLNKGVHNDDMQTAVSAAAIAACDAPQEQQWGAAAARRV